MHKEGSRNEADGRKSMNERPLVIAALIVVLGALIHASTFAADNEVLRSFWQLNPDVTMSHPRKHHIAVVAPEATDIVMCRFHYDHGRSTDYDSAYPHLSSGGKIKVTFQIVAEEGSRKLAKTRSKVRIEDNGQFDNRSTILGWADSAGDFDGLGEFEYKRNRNFPVHLAPGDMLLWTVQFKGMPQVESQPDADPWFRDGIGLGAICRSCGTPRTPCPDQW
jgi:hypothetical protein